MSGRRSNGEGSVYRRKDGRYEGAAYLQTITGRRKRIRVYGKTRSEAHTKLVTQLAQASQGVLVPERAWTVGGYLDYWMQEIVPTTRRPKTVELYESTVRLHIKPRLGSKSLARLSVATLQQVLNQQLAEGHSVRTVALTRTVLSAAITRAQREELVTRNVARLVELPTWERKDIHPWSAQEAAHFLAYARDEPLYPAFLLVTLYGLRRGEVLGLRWCDVDWDHDQLNIRQQVQQIGNVVVQGPVKTSAGRRDLPLLAVVRQALSRHQVIQQGRVEQAEAELVFASEVGTPIWPRNFVRVFHRVRASAGVRRVTVHHLRHTAATLLKNLGVPARDAQLILGHAHISTTQQLYQHGDVTGQRTALDRVGRVLLVAGTDGERSRQSQPSIVLQSSAEESVLSGGPGGARTHDTLLKSFVRLGRDPALTPVFEQLRARTTTHILGHVAVTVSRQVSATSSNVSFTDWAALRSALEPFPPPFTSLTD